MHTHFSGNVPQNYMPILQLHSEGGVREIFYNLTLHLNDIVFRHTQVPSDVLKFAFFNNDSYC